MLKNMKIGKRLTLSFSLMVVFMVALIWVSIQSMAGINENLNRIVTVNNVRLSHSVHMAEVTREVSIALRNMLLEKESGKVQEMQKRIGENRAKYDESFKKIEEMTSKEDTKGHEAIKAVKEAQDKARIANNKVAELTLAGKRDEAIDLMNKDARPAVRKWLDDIDKLSEHQDARNKMRFEQSQAEFKAAKLKMFGVGGVA